ncbi:Retrovirus-related Pol polyprotein from transposon 17.6 [Dictyocoela muelleri]|nr:Retrovirus-related Pol polyprotein from transposon 17.6 [Dictyocoela muelleri]
MYKTIHRFRTILLKFSIKLKTDNRNSLFKAKDLNSRINRWKESLNEYNLEIGHISGEKNIVADYISRNLKDTVNVLSIFNKSIILDTHKNYGHPGIVHTFKTIKLKFDKILSTNGQSTN